MPTPPGYQPTFQYNDPDQLTPDVINANPGGLPAQLGQTLFSPQNPGRNVMGGGFNFPAAQPMQYNTRGQPMPGAQGATIPPLTPQATTAPLVPNQPKQGAYVGQGVYLPPPGAQTFTQSQGHPNPGLMHQINKDPAMLASLPPTQRDAITRLLEQQLAGAGTVTNALGTGSAEFMNTGFMQENLANNTPFERQLRWDPDRKKYVQIGKLIQEGKLDIRTGKMRKVRNQRGNQAPPRRNSTQVQPMPNSTGMGVVNFNVSSG